MGLLDENFLVKRSRNVHKCDTGLLQFCHTSGTFES
jgi:hypothetical protein